MTINARLPIESKRVQGFYALLLAQPYCTNYQATAEPFTARMKLDSSGGTLPILAVFV